MKLVKTVASVRSYALYQRGAKPAQWQVQTNDGTVLFDVRGRQFADGRRVYSLYRPGDPAPVQRNLTFAEIRALVRS